MYHPENKAQSVLLKIRNLAFIVLFALIAMSQGWALSSKDEASQEKPVMLPDGSVDFGSKSIRKREGYGSFLIFLDNDIQCEMMEVFDFGKGSTYSYNFLNPKEEVVGNVFTYSGEARGELSNIDTAKLSEILGTYRLSMTLLEDGLIKIEAICKTKKPGDLKRRVMNFDLPAFLEATGVYVKGKEKINFDGSSPAGFDQLQLKDARLTFFQDDDAKRFTIVPLECSGIQIRKNKVSLESNADGNLTFLLDLRGGKPKTQNTGSFPNGIQVGDADDLSTPDFGASRNLAMNPSFEAGMRFWAYSIYSYGATSFKYSDIYSLDDKWAHSGKHSLKVRQLSQALPLGTFALPVIPGEKYTVSFWARAEPGLPQRLELITRSSDNSTPEPFIETGSNTFAATDLTSEWKRYSATIVPKTRFVSFYIKPTSSTQVDPPNYVWIDDFQVERGNLTEFSQPPVAAQLLSSARGNFLEYNKPADFRLDIAAPSLSKGSVTLVVEDFFSRTIFEKTFPFETDGEGNASIKLGDLDEKMAKGGLRGVFVANAVFNLDGMKGSYRDYFRFSVMNFLDNTQRNKNIFNLTYAYSLQAAGADHERFVSHERNLGFGSYSYDFIGFADDLDLDLDRERAELMAKYGFAPMGRPLITWTSHAGVISEQGGKLRMEQMKTAVNPSEEKLRDFSYIAEVKARSRPWSPIWYFCIEANPGFLPLSGDLPSFAKFLIASNKGVKKGNPDAKVLLDGGPWNIEPELGTKWVEEYIQAVRKIDPTIKFDGTGGHAYPYFPEVLDRNISEFLKMLDRNGCEDWQMYITEGLCFPPFNLPQMGISPYVWNSANYWYIGPLSYDMGRSEKISAAFVARAWLVGLKYQDRVACMNSFFTPNRYLDIDFTARAWNKSPNTLGRILGNARFFRDVKFTPFSRCYVFKEDVSGAPIAAMWGFKEGVDRFKEKPTEVSFDFGDLPLTFVDFMENEVSFPKNDKGETVIPMTPFPIFIKAPPGTEERLCEAVSKGVEAADTANQSAVSISAYPTGDGFASIVFKNNLAKVITTEGALTLNGVSSDVPLNIGAEGEFSLNFELKPSSPADGTVNDFNFNGRIKNGTETVITGKYIKLKYDAESAAGTESGGYAKWEKYPATKIGSNALFRLAVAKGRIDLSVELKGKDLNPADAFSGLGIYLDPIENVHMWNQPKLALSDLSVFELTKGGMDKVSAYCHYVHGVQAGSGSSVIFAKAIQPRLVVKTSRTPDGVLLECEIPEEILAPLKIAPGCRFGINISLPAKDGLVETLSPISGFKDPANLGDLDLVMVVVGSEG